MSATPGTTNETLTAVHGRVLEKIATGAPLGETLDELVRVVEEGSDEGVIASILLVDEEGRRLRHGSAPSLAAEYCRAIDGVEIGPCVGSCGTAAYREQTVLVSDIATDPLWADFKQLALRYDLRACWSTPIFGSDGAVIGTFANYYRTPRDASPRDRELTRLITRTAAIAIEQDRRRLRLDREMKRLQRIYALTDMLGRAGSLEAIYDEAMSAVQDLLGVRRVSILLFDDDRVMRFKAWRGLSDEYRRAVEGHTPWTPEDVAASPIVVPDVRADPELAAYAEVFRAERIAGLGFFPLRTRQVLGKFMAYLDEPRALSSDEIRAAETIAHHMAFAVERARREEKLQQTNAIVRAVFDQTTDVVFVKDREGHYVMVNAAAAHVAGMDASRLIGRTARDVFPGESGEAIMRRDAELMASGGPRTIEEPVFSDGRERTFLSTKGAWRDTEGNVIGLIGISRDITDRKLAEETLRRRERQQAALAEFGAAAISETDLERLIERACTMARELVSGECAEFRELPAGDAPARRVCDGPLIDEDSGDELAALAVAASSSTAVRDFDQHPRFTPRSAENPRRLRAGISTVVRGGARRPYATLSVLSVTPADYSADDIHFMQSLANVLGMAIERHAVLEASRASEERFRSLSACSPTGIFLTDVQGLCNYTNASCQQICGFSAEEALGAGWATFIHSEDRQKVFEQWTRTASSGSRFDDVSRFVHKDGSVHWAHIRTAPVRGDRDQLLGHVGTVEDITATREMTDALRAANQAKDEFLATLSHELRTPMTAILGWTRLLQLGDLDDEAKKVALESIESSTRAQAQIVEDILDVSRIITGKMAIESRRIQLDAIVRAAVDAIRPAAAAKHIAIDVQLASARTRATGDPNRLRQVVWNLLTNAIKFTPPGGRVRVTLACDAQGARIEVADSGEGIAAALLPHVFERFRQGDSSSTRAHGGLGLGLAIVRHLVELHGGTVSAASEGPGRGATFTVRLPLLHGRTRTPGAMSPRGDGSSSRLPSLRRKRILLVDDEEQTRTFLSTLLLQCGAEVRASASAAEAMAESWNPHVVVSDLAMPQEDGYSLIARLRVRRGRKRPRFAAIALTAYSRPEDRDRALAAGFDRFLLKPVEPLELARVIASTMRARRDESADAP